MNFLVLFLMFNSYLHNLIIIMHTNFHFYLTSEVKSLSFSCLHVQFTYQNASFHLKKLSTLPFTKLGITTYSPAFPKFSLTFYNFNSFFLVYHKIRTFVFRFCSILVTFSIKFSILSQI